MNRTTSRSHFGFIGFGLIGGSIAKGLRKIYPDSKLIAYNYYETRPHPKLEMAKADGVLTEVTDTLADFSDCDVLFLCAPVITNVAYLKKLIPYLSETCIITDVGSVKENIHTEIEALGLGGQFVGGHPMAGSEKTGYEHSDLSIFKNAYYLLTPTEETAPEYTKWMIDFANALGSLTMVIDAKTHDRITAGISHGPHVISAALVNTVASLDQEGNYRKLAAGGFRDITRIASSSPEMWQNICLTNPDAIEEFLGQFIAQLTRAKDAVAHGDGKTLTEFFSSAREYRSTIQK
ncbi:MAG: prephenate dehydrogenase/arogenate dehydrogenase family protein [Clostridiaceae bacterium]|nr:prephenate dehydrogenase/arogenate dehydrogenase family protein [Clostridiaceae bacterium]